MILKGLAGTLAGVTSYAVSTVTASAVVIVMLLLSLGCGLVSLLLAYPTLDGTGAFHAISSIMIPQALYNGVLGAGIFWLIHKFCHTFRVGNFAHARR